MRGPPPDLCACCCFLVNHECCCVNVSGEGQAAALTHARTPACHVIHVHHPSAATSARAPRAPRGAAASSCDAPPDAFCLSTLLTHDSSDSPFGPSKAAAARCSDHYRDYSSAAQACMRMKSQAASSFSSVLIIIINRGCHIPSWRSSVAMHTRLIPTRLLRRLIPDRNPHSEGPVGGREDDRQRGIDEAGSPVDQNKQGTTHISYSSVQ